MADIKTSAQLRGELARAEWNEYQQARLQRQRDRVVAYQARIDDITRKRDEAKAEVAKIEADIKSGIVGIVPKPAPGGVVIAVPTGNIGLKGN